MLITLTILLLLGTFKKLFAEAHNIQLFVS